MRVLLADDDVHVRSAVRLLLEQEPGIRIVGESATTESLLEQVAQTRAEVVLLDWDLPGLHVNDVVSALLATGKSGTRLIVLSGRPEQRAAALRAGADAFVCKGDDPEVLLAAVRSLRERGIGEAKALPSEVKPELGLR